MPKANRVIVILGLAAALLFAGGLLRLLVLRFQAGDIYPPYSSLRSDPLGARAFFDSLKRLPGLTVTRHFTGPRELGSEAATLILAGLGPGAMEGPQNDMAVLQRFVADGGRAVLMLRAVKPRRPTDEDEPAVSQGKKGNPPAVKDDSTAETISIRTIDLQAEWAFRLETPPLGSIRPEAHRAPAAGQDLPAAIAWRSGMVLEAGHADWHVLYRVDGWPVIMERRLGRGSILVATDSYLISNEALRSHRQPVLLGHLIGSNRKVIFDETHFGIQHRPGVSSLIRRYRLHGMIAGLILLVGLFIWRNGHSFPAAPPDSTEQGFRMAYQETDRALMSLIGRHLPDDQLLDACVASYEQSMVGPAAETTARRARIKALAAAAGKDPVPAYQSICQYLKRRPSR